MGRSVLVNRTEGRVKKGDSQGTTRIRYQSFLLRRLFHHPKETRRETRTVPERCLLLSDILDGRRLFRSAHRSLPPPSSTSLYGYLPHRPSAPEESVNGRTCQSDDSRPRSGVRTVIGNLKVYPRNSFS